MGMRVLPPSLLGIYNPLWFVRIGRTPLTTFIHTGDILQYLNFDFSPIIPDSMFAALKNFVDGGKGARKAAAIRAQKISEQHDAFIRFHQRHDPTAYTGVPFQDYHPEKWPSPFHPKCDIEFCGFPNRPCTTPGNHRCGHPSCPGNFYVSPEMAAATALDKERRRRKKEYTATIRNIDTVHSGILRSSGKSAMEARRQRVPSFSSVATAPTLVRFPQPDASFTSNSLHPTATSTRRTPRPSLPAHAQLRA
ncbi:hypothetical protein MSAN_00809100 [Mycena sanguinolenta]|uniref:Uncharacterized protein n=1 Tax=Mycena sanguinolenta TaxID=230812 RepID=A0A8H6YYT7_9AGAR|nr:hypothetical protein MSAN_00809100 [Mycena sanguinolenta]